MEFKMVALIVSIIAITLILEVYPQMEGVAVYTGTQLQDATGYSADTSEIDSTRASIWNIAFPLLALAFIYEILSSRRDEE